MGAINALRWTTPPSSQARLPLPPIASGPDPLGQGAERALGLPQHDRVDLGPEGLVGREGRVGAAHDDEGVRRRATDGAGQPSGGLVPADPAGDHDDGGVDAANGPVEVGLLVLEEQAGPVAFRLQDARHIAQGEALVDGVVLQEQDVEGCRHPFSSDRPRGTGDPGAPSRGAAR